MAEYYRCKEGFAYPGADGQMAAVGADALVSSDDPAYKHNPAAFELVSKSASDRTTRRAGKKADAPVEAATAAPGEKRTTTRRKDS